MKAIKFFFLIVLAGYAFSCSKESEPKPVVPDNNPPVDTTKAPIDTVKTQPSGTPALRLYFSDRDDQRIGVIDLKNLSTRTLLNYEKNGLTSPLGICINQRSKKLYITEYDDGKILRVNLDSTLFRLVYDSDRGIDSATSVAIDTVSKKIYWANSGSRQIMEGDLFGSVEPVALFNGANVIENCYGLAVDHANNKIYFCDNNLHQVLVGSLDGIGMPTILYDEKNFENIGCPTGLVINDDKIYWADDCQNTIVSANANGLGVPTVLFDSENDNISLATGLAIDKAAKKLYWSETDNNLIARGNLDGTGDKEIILEGIQSYGLALEFE